MKVNVNTITDFSFGFLTHNLIPPPPAPPTPVPTPSIEMPATALWTLGFAMNQNKFSNGAKPVTHKAQWVMLDGHDCGMMIPDLTIPPAPNIAYPINWPFSSRKPAVAASTVKFNGTAVACAQWIGLPPVPMMSCGDPISAPVAWSALTVMNPLQVGMTLMDLAAGAINVAASMLTDYVFSKLDININVGTNFANAAVNTVINGIVSNVVSNSLKGLSPATILGGGLASSLTGNATFSASLGLPFAGVTASYTPHPDAGSPSTVFGGAVPGARADTTGAGQVLGTPVKL